MNEVCFPDTASVDAAIDLALARGVLYRVISQGLRPPGRDAARSLSSAATQAALRDAAALLDAACTSGEPLRPAVDALCGESLTERDRLLAHAQLFGHSRGLVCPFETEYGPDGAFRQPQELADIAGYYLAFGLRPAEGADERVDHAACECEFMDFLARKEAFALASLRKDSDEAEAEERIDTIRMATRGFLRGHLGRFGCAFASLLMKEAAEGFHRALGALLYRLVTKECHRLGLPAGPPALELRPPTTDDTPMACGTCDEPIDVQRRPEP